MKDRASTRHRRRCGTGHAACRAVGWRRAPFPATSRSLHARACPSSPSSQHQLCFSLAARGFQSVQVDLLLPGWRGADRPAERFRRHSRPPDHGSRLQQPPRGLPVSQGTGFPSELSGLLSRHLAKVRTCALATSRRCEQRLLDGGGPPMRPASRRRRRDGRALARGSIPVPWQARLDSQEGSQTCLSA